MEIIVNLMGRVPRSQKVLHFSLTKNSNDVQLHGASLKNWLETDLGPAFRESLNMTVRFKKTTGVVEIVVDNMGLTRDIITTFERAVEVNFRNLDSI